MHASSWIFFFKVVRSLQNNSFSIMFFQLFMLDARKSSNMKLSQEIFFCKIIKLYVDMNPFYTGTVHSKLCYNIETIESFHEHYFSFENKSPSKWLIDEFKVAWFTFEASLFQRNAISNIGQYTSTNKTYRAIRRASNIEWLLIPLLANEFPLRISSKKILLNQHSFYCLIPMFTIYFRVQLD